MYRCAVAHEHTVVVTINLIYIPYYFFLSIYFSLRSLDAIVLSLRLLLLPVAYMCVCDSLDKIEQMCVQCVCLAKNTLQRSESMYDISQIRFDSHRKMNGATEWHRDGESKGESAL